MSEIAKRIEDARRAHVRSLGTPTEADAFEHLRALVDIAKRDDTEDNKLAEMERAAKKASGR